MTVSAMVVRDGGLAANLTIMMMRVEGHVVVVIHIHGRGVEHRITVDRHHRLNSILVRFSPSLCLLGEECMSGATVHTSVHGPHFH